MRSQTNAMPLVIQIIKGKFHVCCRARTCIRAAFIPYLMCASRNDAMLRRRPRLSTAGHGRPMRMQADTALSPGASGEDQRMLALNAPCQRELAKDAASHWFQRAAAGCVRCFLAQLVHVLVPDWVLVALCPSQRCGSATVSLLQSNITFVFAGLAGQCLHPGVLEILS